MPRLANISGQEAVKVFERAGWQRAGQVGSHLVLTSDMPAEVAKIPEGSFVLLMTMGHTTDKPILLEILRTRKFPYLGVIGSNAKAKQLRKDVEDAALPAEMQSAFFCPIGLDVGTNHPQEIAISIAAQLLQTRDRSGNQRALQGDPS